MKRLNKIIVCLGGVLDFRWDLISLFKQFMPRKCSNCR